MSSKLKICLTGIFLFLQIYLSAQEKTENYIKDEIPDSLRKDADAVCRLDEHIVEIKSPGKITVWERHVYTILNSNADHLASYNTHYNKLTTINDVDGTLYNAEGRNVKRLKKKDMTDLPNDGIAFVSDDRVKTGGFSFSSYPYTVAFEEEDDKAGAYYIPDWYPPRSQKMSVVLSRYVLIAPVSYKVRLKMINMDVKPTVTTSHDKITYTWEIRNLPVIPYEPYAVSSDIFDPEMLVGASDFELEGYKGNISTWNDFGKFYNYLYLGRDQLPEDLKHQVHLMTDQIQDPYQKISVLYDYLQKNTHYVLISFGIGGLQPYDAVYVAKNKYGDCKALSNFMVALLKEAGIKGYPVAIWGGDDARTFIVDFPSHQSNHIICAVPVGKDTVWLECTDQYLPSGYLSSFTANRYGLLIGEDGGTLVHTPVYGLEDNTSSRKTKAELGLDGNLQIKAEASYKALSQDDIEKLIHHTSRDKQLEYLKKSFDFPTYTVNSFEYKEDHSARLPVIHEWLDLSVTNYASVSGKRIFLNPNIFERSVIRFPELKDRKLDLEFDTPQRETDTVEIKIPEGYILESKHKDMLVVSKYGKYQMKTELTGNSIRYYRQLDIFSGRFPAADYGDVKAFYQAIYDADHSKMVLIKNTVSQ